MAGGDDGPRAVASGGTLSFHAILAAQAPGWSAAVLGGDAPIIQIYTSGTTGTPKGVVVSVRALAGFRADAEAGLGVLPGDLYWYAADPGWAFGIQRLTRLAGKSKAMEMCLTSRMMDAAEAERSGLVSAWCPAQRCSAYQSAFSHSLRPMRTLASTWFRA